jgi:predicted RNA-binding Zn ribbon-like protein
VFARRVIPVNALTVESPSGSDVRLVGGDLAVDFVNTVDADVPGGDHLPTYEAFRAWSERLGLSAGRQTLADVHVVRARLDAVLRPLACGDTPPPAALAALRDLERDALARAELRPGGWTWPAGSALDRLVHAGTQLLVSERHRQLRVCANCTWLFLDLSRNHSRKWCSMEHCGTQVKIRRLSERRRSQR